MSNDTRICYRPDGSSLPDQVPCSSSEYTHCCKTGSICLANGFCAPTAEPYVFYRGGCTNQRWDQGCPEYCSTHCSFPSPRYIAQTYRDTPQTNPMTPTGSNGKRSQTANTYTAAPGSKEATETGRTGATARGPLRYPMMGSCTAARYWRISLHSTR